MVDLWWPYNPNPVGRHCCGVSTLPGFVLPNANRLFLRHPPPPTPPRPSPNQPPCTPPTHTHTHTNTNTNTNTHHNPIHATPCHPQPPRSWPNSSTIIPQQSPSPCRRCLISHPCPVRPVDVGFGRATQYQPPFDLRVARPQPAAMTVAFQALRRLIVPPGGGFRCELRGGGCSPRPTPTPHPPPLLTHPL